MGMKAPTWRKAVAAIASVPMLLTGFALSAGTAVADDSAAAQPAAQAETPAPLASFDFNAAPTDGAFVSAGDTGAKATVEGTAALVDRDTDNGKAAQFSKDFWLNVTDKDGAALLKGKDAVTISYDSKANATGGAWAVFAASNANAVDGNAPTYVGLLDQTNKTRLERYLNGRGNDAATIDQNAGTNNAWKHVDIVIDGATAKLYVNQKLIGTNDKGSKLTDILGAEGGVLQVGKGNWGNGEYFTGQLDNLKIYGEALTAPQLGIPDPTALTITGSGVKDGALSLKEGSVSLLSTTSQPDKSDPTVAKWESNNPAVATVNAYGKVAGVKAGTATITATSAIVPTLKAELKVTVETAKPDDQYGYAMVHFIENNKGYAEKIYLDISRGDDPYQWDTLNGGQPILASNESTTGVRDPFIAYNPETETYYILATDLRVFGGDNGGDNGVNFKKNPWTTWANNYSTKLHVWSSKDLIHFSDMNELETATADKYTATPTKTQTLIDSVTGKTISEIGMAWAPEATWVPNFYDLNDDGIANNSDANNPENEKGGAFVMYWSTSAKYDGANQQPGKKVTHVLWAATKDFTNATYMFGGVYVPNSKYMPGNTIDTTMLQNTIKDADGTEHLRSYRTTGSGHLFMEYTDRADWWRANDKGQYATDPADGWVISQTDIGHSFGSNQEGANGFKVNGQNEWIMFVDNYGSVASGARYGYNPVVATNLDAENPWSPLNVTTTDFFLTANTKHGGVVSLTKAKYDAIRAADAKASDNKDVTAGEADVYKDDSADAVKAALPTTAKVQLSNGFGEGEVGVNWDADSLAAVDTSKPDTYTVTGVADTIGANKNHWSWAAADGAAKTDEDDLDNTNGNANNSWKQTGGFVDNATANKNRPLYSSTAIKVTATVTVGADERPQVDSVVVKGDVTELEPGATTTLKAEVGPEAALDKAVTWSSSDEKAATVAEDGTVTAAADLTKDAKVTITATAANGVKGEYTITVKAKETPKPTWRFTDVTSATPHASDIQWLADNGISTGWKTGDTTAVFSPMGPVIRQDMAAFLYRLAGSPAYEPSEADKAKFTDVTPETPHYKEILWLASTGIAKGFRQADGTYQFGGDRLVVRQDMAAFLKNLADVQGADPALGEGIDFTDVDGATPHSAEIAWLAQAGVTTGWEMPDGTSEFRGMNVVVRQDMAAFLHRMDSVLK